MDFNVNFNTLQYFIDIVDEGSFTRAAKKNFVAQTALSHAMSNLEKKMELKLLNRGKGKVTPTDGGKLFYDECRHILEVHRQTMQKILELKPAKKEIWIGFVDVFECREFSKIQNRLKKRFPDYQIEWVNRYSVSDEELDLVVAYDVEPRIDGGEGGSIELTAEITGSDIAWMVPVTSKLAGKKKLYAKDLEGQTVICLVRNRYLDEAAYKRWLSKTVFKGISCDLRLVYSAAERRTLVECGEGIALFEKNLFKYNEEQTVLVDRGNQCGVVTYIISYRDEIYGKVAGEIQQFLLESCV